MEKSLKIIFTLSTLLFSLIIGVNNSNAANLASTLKGKILLQVESKGEAWYVSPADSKRYSMGRPNDAFDLMRNQGVGISNDNLKKIKIADKNLTGQDSDNDGLSDMAEDSIGTDKNNKDSDTDGYNDKDEIMGGYNPSGSGKLSLDNNFAKNQAGRIFLQVEKHGEAWYVNPDNYQRYFLSRPGDAFRVMRELGLGITDKNLSLISKAYNSFKFTDSANGLCRATLDTCAAGTFLDTTDSDTQSFWSCNGVNGGASANCSLDKAINALCGAAVRTFLSSETFPGTYAYCAVGTANPLSPLNPLVGGSSSWTCLGAYGGSDSPTCTATRLSLVEDNNPPVLAPIGAKTVNENVALAFVLSATDTDGDALTYSASGIPSGATFNTSTKTFSWTPSNTQSGNYAVTFSVNDGKGGIDSKTINITVVHINQAPIVSSPTNLSANISDFNQYKRINLAWQAPSIGASLVAGYEVYRGNTLITSTPALSYQDTGQGVGILLPDISYCYSVLAYANSATRSQTSSSFCVTLPRGATLAPSNLTGVATSSNSVQLTWQYPLTWQQQAANKDIILFVVEKSLDGANWIILGYGSKTDLTAQPGARNYYRVTAFSSKTGYSATSNIAEVDVPAALAVPNAPSNLAVSFPNVMVTTIQLLWKDNANDETGFSVERFNLSSDSWAQVATSPPTAGNSVQYFLFNLPLADTYTYRVRAFNSVGSSEPTASVSITTPAPLSWTPPDPSDNLLVVYNTNLNPEVSDGAASTTLKDYYLAKRPGILNANVLGVDTSTSLENIGEADFNSTIRAPIVDWMQANPGKHIRYIVMMYGMPTRVQSPPYGPATLEFGSVDYRVSRALQSLNIRKGVEYRSGSNSRYMPDYHQGTTVLVSRLDMGTAEATKAYIDKLAAAGSGLIISGQSSEVGGSTYYFDDVTTSSLAGLGKNAQDAVLAENSSAPTTYSNTAHIFTVSDVKGYMTFGANGQIGMDYAIDGKIKFSGKSGWYILQTIESWNGQRFNTGWPGTGQGSFVDWFAPNAFGSTNYENTPVGAVSHTSEPGGTGVNSEDYFRLWERGYLFIEAAWASRNTVYFMATGDPFVTR